jgi:D-sedoheptulose 7-phosphate isomerase
MADPRPDISAFFERSRALFESAAKDAAMLESVAKIAETITQAFRRGDKLLIAGNGGSAADAQHIAAEFLCRFKIDRAALPAIALTTDTSNLTAIGNDLGFDRIFERQVRGLGRKGDVFIGITTSGRSPNVVAALKAAREMGVTTIGFTGNPGKAMSTLCDLTLIAPSDETALIQQIHITAAHAICEVVERQMFPAAKG